MRKYLVSLIIPAFNEEKLILPTLQKWTGYFKQMDFVYEIIVADDGSTDKTADIVNEFVVQNSNIKFCSLGSNIGKGAALKRGISLAKGDFLILTDADYPYDPFLMKWVGDYLKSGDFEVIIGDRTLEGSKFDYFKSLKRKMAGSVFSSLKGLIVMNKYPDTQCGFKLFRADIAKKIIELSRLSDFSFDLEMIFIAHLNNCNILRMPVIQSSAKNEQRRSKVKLLNNSLVMLADLLKLRFYKKYYGFDKS